MVEHHRYESTRLLDHYGHPVLPLSLHPAFVRLGYLKKRCERLSEMDGKIKENMIFIKRLILFENSIYDKSQKTVAQCSAIHNIFSRFDLYLSTNFIHIKCKAAKSTEALR